MVHGAVAWSMALHVAATADRNRVLPNAEFGTYNLKASAVSLLMAVVAPPAALVWSHAQSTRLGSDVQAALSGRRALC